jgi:hypothetical protein
MTLSQPGHVLCPGTRSDRIGRSGAPLGADVARAELDAAAEVGPARQSHRQDDQTRRGWPGLRRSPSHIPSTWIRRFNASGAICDPVERKQQTKARYVDADQFAYPLTAYLPVFGHDVGGAEAAAVRGFTPAVIAR